VKNAISDAFSAISAAENAFLVQKNAVHRQKCASLRIKYGGNVIFS
jgi:hypothetical protein